jgi:hypothetical protein
MVRRSKKEKLSKSNDKVFESEHSIHLDGCDYNSLHKKIVDYVVSGKMHSTLIGITIDLDGGKKDIIEATRLADFIINFLKKVN